MKMANQSTLRVQRRLKMPQDGSKNLYRLIQHKLNYHYASTELLKGTGLYFCLRGVWFQPCVRMCVQNARRFKIHSRHAKAATEYHIGRMREIVIKTHAQLHFIP